MKLSEIHSTLSKLGKNSKAISHLIDLKVAEEMRTYEAEIKSLHFKVNTLMWVLAVIVLGFLAKLFIGV